MATSKGQLTPLYVRIPQSQSKRLDRMVTALGQTKQQVVTELLGTGLADAVASAPPAASDEVLNIEQVAALLSVTTEAVGDAVRTAGLPGRRIGTEWRFARQAVLAWLATPDPSIKARPGFTGRAK
jgi:excisionase family DNA binding protein